MRKSVELSLNRFFSKCSQLKYKKGEIIVRGGETPKGVYFLRKGFTRLFNVSAKGEELTKIIYKPGDIFPFIWAINETPNDYFLEAMTSTNLCRAPRSEFIKFLENNPEAFWELTSRILVRFNGILSRMDYLVFGNAYSKVASILVICAERFGKKVGESIIIQVPLTHNDIARLIGLTRETTSIEMKKLEDIGFIKHKGRFISIENIKKLKREFTLET